MTVDLSLWIWNQVIYTNKDAEKHSEDINVSDGREKYNYGISQRFTQK